MQHARDGAVVDGLVGIHRFGVIVLDERVDVGELLEAVLDFGVAGDGRLLAGTSGQTGCPGIRKQGEKKLPERAIGVNYGPSRFPSLRAYFHPSYRADIRQYITTLDCPGPGLSPW